MRWITRPCNLTSALDHTALQSHQRAGSHDPACSPARWIMRCPVISSARSITLSPACPLSRGPAHLITQPYNLTDALDHTALQSHQRTGSHGPAISSTRWITRPCDLTCALDHTQPCPLALKWACALYHTALQSHLRARSCAALQSYLCARTHAAL